MNFKSDNTSPISMEILKSLESVNKGFQNSYGDDISSSLLQERLCDIFEHDVNVFLTNTGTAANFLGLASMVRPYEAIFCSQEAHIYTDECGACELHTGGAKLIPIEGVHGKLNPEALEAHIRTLLSMRPHAQKPGCVSISQSTECGTVYSVEELEKIGAVCRTHKLPLHMDGARFANALVQLNISPAEMTWKRGVDVLSFGATKNGAMCAEAIVLFNKTYAEGFDYRHKMAGQLMSKGRFFASQFLAYLDMDLWLKNATHANQMARSLGFLFEEKGLSLMYPVQANEIFVTLSPSLVQYLQDHGAGFYGWSHHGSNLYRFVTSWYTSNEDLSSFEQHLEAALARN